MRHLTISKDIKIVNTLVKHAEQPGYHFVNAQLEEPKEGYLVLFEHGLYINMSFESIDEDELNEWINEKLKAGVNKHLFFSVLNKDNQVYFYISLNTPSKLTALRIAEDHNQGSIFDVKNNRIIELKQ